jgi:hypothetical protein
MTVKPIEAQAARSPQLRLPSWAMARLLPGVVLAALTLVIAGCGPLGGGSPKAAPIPNTSPVSTPQAGPPAAAQDLTFSGDLSGTLTTLVANDAGEQSSCTGVGSRAQNEWTSTLDGYLGSAVYSVVVVAKPYRGPGSYDSSAVTVEVNSVDDKQVWQSSTGDPVTFSVARNELTGTLQATLHSADTNQPSLKVTGSWSCEP